MTSLLPILDVDQNRATVSSLQLAEHFGIKHHHVLRDIKAILRKVPESFNASNFGFVTYLDDKGESRPSYNLTRDGFTLLAMGYNSARAIEWKLKYIEAFNKLERIALEAARKEAHQVALVQGAQAALGLTPANSKRMKKILGYIERGFSQREIAAVLGISRRGVGKTLTAARKLGLGV